jgi:hypothetical protein
MSSTSAMSLKKRVTQMFWMGNAMVCAVLALLGGMMSLGASSYDPQLSVLFVRAGAVFAIPGVMLTIFSLWKVRSTSMAL